MQSVTQEQKEMFFNNITTYDFDRITRFGFATCPNCGKRFLKKTEGQRFDSRECAVEYKQKTKVCAHCKKEKSITEFNKKSGSKDGLQSWCRECTNKDHRNRRQSMQNNDIEILPETKVCARCGKAKPIIEFSKNSTADDGLQSWCKDCVSDYGKNRRQNSVTEKDVPSEANSKPQHKEHSKIVSLTNEIAGQEYEHLIQLIGKEKSDKLIKHLSMFRSYYGEQYLDMFREILEYISFLIEFQSKQDRPIKNISYVARQLGHAVAEKELSSDRNYKESILGNFKDGYWETMEMESMKSGDPK